MPNTLILTSAKGLKSFTVIFIEHEQVAEHTAEDCERQGNLFAQLIWNQLPAKTVYALNEELDRLHNRELGEE